MVLCDTNVLSELMRARPDAGVTRWAATVTAVAVSVITVEEIAYGLAWHPNVRVEEAVTRFLSDWCTVMPITPDIASRAGRLRGELQRHGATRTQADMLIAATALENDLPVVTRNTRDFEGLGIPLLNPFFE